MSSSATMPGPSPALPHEIISESILQIRHFSTRSPWLWHQARLVSTAWKKNVEQTFKQHHLKHTSIDVELGVYNSRRYGRVPLSASFKYQSLSTSPDDSIATFKATVRPAFLPLTMERLRLCASQPSFFTVTVRTEVRDVLSGTLDLNFDCDNLEITLNWRSLFSHFFLEADLDKTYLQEFVGAVTSAIDFERNPEGFLAAVLPAVPQARKEARRDRISLHRMANLKQTDARRPEGEESGLRPDYNASDLRNELYPPSKDGDGSEDEMTEEMKLVEKLNTMGRRLEEPLWVDDEESELDVRYGETREVVEGENRRETQRRTMQEMVDRLLNQPRDLEGGPMGESGSEEEDDEGDWEDEDEEDGSDY